MSTHFVGNLIPTPTGDYGDNTEWLQKSMYSSSSSCDNGMSSCWYVGVADEQTQVTLLAPREADVTLQTINESGDFTKETNEICIHDLGKGTHGYLPITDEYEDDPDKGITKNIQCDEFDGNNYSKFERYKGKNLMPIAFQDDIQKKRLLEINDFEQFNNRIQYKVYNNDKIKIITKSSKKNCSEDRNDYFTKSNNKKTLQMIAFNNVANMERKLNKNVYKHVPHKDRPPLIVARRNARERRRVQAVNSAFMKLRKIVPLANNRGKRISKVKTLQTAIDYISGLQALLKQADMYHHDLHIISEYHVHTNDYHRSLEDFENEF